MQYNFENGEILLVDKPLHWTSFDVVNKIRYLISPAGQKSNRNKIKTGHAGTLDPLATGLLILCTGKFTRRITEFQDLDKEYAGTFYLGATTPSFDLETEVSRQFEISHITHEDIENAAKKFTGEIWQAPPAFSAKQIDGKRAYHSARKGKAIQLEPRKVTIKEFEITGINLPLVKFRVACSKGTYIRSLASDFGKELNSGAYLHSLCRTRIGGYKLEDAWKLEELVNFLQKKVNQTV